MGAFDDLALGPIYTDPILSCAAVYTPIGGAATPIRAIDMTAGVQFGDGMSKAAGVRPAAAVRKSDMPTPPTGASFIINGTRYIIDAYQPKLNGDGMATGELLLTLKAA